MNFTASRAELMAAITLTSKVRASADHVACDLDDETVLLSLRTGEYYGLNEVAASVWKLVQAPITVNEILASLMEEFEADDAERCGEEVVLLLNQLRELELVEVSI